MLCKLLAVFSKITSCKLKTIFFKTQTYANALHELKLLLLILAALLHFSFYFLFIIRWINFVSISSVKIYKTFAYAPVCCFFTFFATTSRHLKCNFINNFFTSFAFFCHCRAVKFTSKLFGRALSKRIKATILYATETGKSEQYAKQLCELLGHAFNAQVKWKYGAIV